MPFATYKDFKDCLNKNKDKENPEAYCAEIKRKVEGDFTEDYPVREYERTSKGGKKHIVKTHSRGEGKEKARQKEIEDAPEGSMLKNVLESKYKEKRIENKETRQMNKVYDLMEKYNLNHIEDVHIKLGEILNKIDEENLPKEEIDKLDKIADDLVEIRDLLDDYNLETIDDLIHITIAKEQGSKKYMKLGKYNDITDMNSRSKSDGGGNMPGSDQNELDFTPGFYNIDGTLHQIDEKGNIFRLDFDINQSIKNNMENDTNMKEDISGSKAYDEYWKETSQTKIDGSTAMMETRISKCMELTGKSQEECSKEVKARMKNAGSENTNTEDMEKEDTKKEETEKVEVCKKEYDFLKEKYEELKNLEEQKKESDKNLASLKEDFGKYVKMFDEIKAERDIKIEEERQNKISQLAKDFDLPEEELKDDSMEDLIKMEKRLDMALKRNNKDDDIEDDENEDSFDKINDMTEEIKSRFFMEV